MATAHSQSCPRWSWDRGGSQTPASHGRGASKSEQHLPGTVRWGAQSLLPARQGDQTEAGYPVGGPPAHPAGGHPPACPLPVPPAPLRAVARAHRPGAQADSGARSSTPPPRRLPGQRRRRSGPRRRWRDPGPPGAAPGGSPALQPPATRALPPYRRSSSSPCARPRTPDLDSSRGPRSPPPPRTPPHRPSYRPTRPHQGRRQQPGAGVASRAAPLSRAPAHAEGPRGRFAVPGGAPVRRRACRFNKPSWEWKRAGTTHPRRAPIGWL